MILEYLRFSKDMLFIYLLVRPKVDISGASNLIIEGNSVNLTCKVVEGRPEPQITWLKNNTLHRQSLSLFFSEITKGDEGWYTCKAENAAGFDTKDIDISVKGVFVKCTVILYTTWLVIYCEELESLYTCSFVPALKIWWFHG